MLAKTLLTANDIDHENTTLLSLGGEAAAAALADGRVDAAFFVSAALPARLRALIKRPDIHLADFAQADAYQRRYKYLSRINLPQGVLDLSANLPATDMTLVAPTGALVVRDDIHPALIDLLLGAAIEIHRSGNLTTPFGLFPSPKFVDFPLNSDAERFLESGPTFLRRVLPFGAAILVERLVIMLLPLLTLMIPLFRIAPPAYRWGIRRKVYRWYKELKRIEQDWQAKGAGSETATIVARLDTIQDQVGHVRIPLSYAEHLYHLRLHIGFVRQLVTGDPVPVRRPDGAEDD